MDNALRVAILGMHFHPETTGNAPYTSALARALRRTHEVRVLTAHPHYPEWRIREGFGAWTAADTHERVPVRRMLHYVPARPNAARRVLSELTFGIRLITARWGRPDVVIMVSPALVSSAMAIARIRLTPRSRRPASLVWVQDLYGLGVAETAAGGRTAARLMSKLEGGALRSASAVVTIHERFAAHLTTRLGVDPKRVSVIRNWSHVNDLDASVQPPRSSTRSELGWGTDEIIVLHAGNQGVKQGLDNVLEAARLPIAAERRIRFVLMGDGNQRPRLEQQAKDLSQVSFIDSVPSEAFLATLRAADILLVNESPGVRDMSVPSKLTSYFAAGVPVVAASAPDSATAEEVRRSGAGLIVDAGDPVALLTAVLEIHADPNRAQELGRSGLTYRELALSESTAVERFLELVRTVHGCNA